MRLLFPALLMLGATPALAQHDDHDARNESAAVLATIDKLFDALNKKDADAMGAVTIAEGRTTGTRISPDGKASIQSGSWVDFRRRLPTLSGTSVEKLVDPHVQFEGVMAMVWSPYTFTLDGKFSHCGINHFDLVKQDGQWRVLNLTWSQRTTDCPGL